jgi:hypothetical protein
MLLHNFSQKATNFAKLKKPSQEVEFCLSRYGKLQVSFSYYKNRFPIGNVRENLIFKVSERRLHLFKQLVVVLLDLLLAIFHGILQIV